MKIIKFVCAVALSSVLFLTSAYAATYYVDAVNGSDVTGTGSQAAPWRTLTNAVASTVAGDTVNVLPGTYNVALGETFPIVIAGKFFVATTTYLATIEESGASTRAVALVGNASLEGFKVKGDGNDTAVTVGMIDAASNVTVKNNIIDGSNFTYGIQCIQINDTVRITSNTIYSSTRGIFVNTSLTSGSVTKNTIRDCTNYGIYVNQSNLTIDRNTIVRSGVGVYADTGGGAGKNVNAKNNIIYNAGVRTSGISQAGAVGTLTSTYNCVFGNATVYDGTVADKTGDITVDPTFIDTTGNNFNLMPASPCIDTGDPVTVLDPDGSRADMGAYPYDHRPTVQIVRPNGGETLTGEVSYNITWTATQAGGVDHLQLYYSTDGGTTYPNTITTSAPSTGSYGWSVPAINTTTARARLIAVAINGYTATSESAANFSIAFASPTITVPTPTTTTTAPSKISVVGGEKAAQTFAAGAAVNITINGGENQTLNMEVYDKDWNPVTTISNSGTNTFSWNTDKNIAGGLYHYIIKGKDTHLSGVIFISK
ncbi:MAG: right-handed parallel beta-helix repeat-containing protein [Candidatus Margulisbacteria bacterium]|nr:right-handed parallel beta-helix repeat-containing protein [Candidatus Margulisiibacteriota bacterium]